MTDTETEMLATLGENARALAAARNGLATDVAGELFKIDDGCGERLCRHHPLSRTVTALTRTLVAAGFTLHDCATRERTGGVCLTPASLDDGVIVTWTTHHSLALDGSQCEEDRDIHEVMNFALADVLRIFGWEVDTFGRASAHIVTGRAVQPDPASES